MTALPPLTYCINQVSPPGWTYFAQEPFNILEPLIKADPSTRIFSCNELDVSNRDVMLSHASHVLQKEDKG